MSGARANAKRKADNNHVAPFIETDSRPSKKLAAPPAKPPHYAATKHLLTSLGGGWAGMPPFSGDEDRLYRWIAEPALWARVIMGDVEPRTQQRLIGLHAGLQEGINASGFVLWRSLPPMRPPLKVTVRAAVETRRINNSAVALPHVSLKQAKFAPSSHYGAGWEARSHAGPYGCATRRRRRRCRPRAAAAHRVPPSSDHRSPVRHLF